MAALSKVPIDTYFEVPSQAETTTKTLDSLLARDDIHAVVVCLPILAQPNVIQKALKAGKHVLSEKPIAKDVTTGKSLIDFYKSLTQQPIWAVGENLRFIDPVVAGAKRIKEIGGKVVSFSFNMFTLIGDDDKFFNTECRLATTITST